MKVLIAFEKSGVLRDEFIAQGYDATSCDIEPTERPGPHIQGDAFEVLYQPGWDLVIAHPECTYLTSAGLHWNTRRPGRAEKTEQALLDVEKVWKCPSRFLALENPQGCINTRLPFMPRPQYVQPYQFGDDASKKTGLWRRGLPELIIDPQWRRPGRLVPWNGKVVERWSNQTDSGQNRLGPGPRRSAERAETYPGLAREIVRQWGLYVETTLAIEEAQR